MARKTYTRDFKLQALRMMADQGLSVAEVARRLGVGENCLRNGRQAARDQGDAAFPGQGNPSPADEELRRLRAEVQRLRAERDLLKKLRRQSRLGKFGLQEPQVAFGVAAETPAFDPALAAFVHLGPQCHPVPSVGADEIGEPPGSLARGHGGDDPGRPA